MRVKTVATGRTINKPFKILVGGSRFYKDRRIVRVALYRHQPETVSNSRMMVVHGGARGADEIADEYAVHRGWQRRSIPVTAEEWKEHGKQAGALRNIKLAQMLPDICLLFPLLGQRNSGTFMMPDLLKRHSGATKILVVHQNGTEEVWSPAIKLRYDKEA